MNNIEKILELSKNSRYTSLEDIFTKENRARKLDAMNKIVTLATDYSHFEDLKKAFSKYRRKVHEIYHIPRVLERTPFTTVPGWTALFPEDTLTAYIYHQYLNNQNPNDRKTIIGSLSGLELFSTIPLKHSSAGKFLGIGKYTTEETDTLFFSRTGIIGDNIESFIKKTFTLYPYEESMQKAQHFVQKVGRALGEIHSYRKEEKTTWPTSLKHFFGKKFDDFQAGVLFNTPGFNAFSFIKEAKTRLWEANKEAYHPTYTVGPSALDHLSFDPCYDTLYFIDFVGAQDSVDLTGRPIGYPVEDIVYFEIILELLIRKHSEAANETDIQSLVKDFNDSYLKEANFFPAQAHIDWMNVILRMIILKMTLANFNDSLPPYGNPHLTICHCLINYLQKTIPA